MATKDAMETLRKEKDAEIAMAEAHAKISEMTAKMDELEKVADRREEMVESASTNWPNES